MKPFAKLAVTAFSGVVLLKLFAGFLLPMLAMLLGLLALTVKLGLIAAVVFFIYSLVRRRNEYDDEHDFEVEVGEIIDDDVDPLKR